MYDVRTGMHTFAGKQYGAVYIFGRAKVRRREKGNERSSAKKKCIVLHAPFLPINLHSSVYQFWGARERGSKYQNVH